MIGKRFMALVEAPSVCGRVIAHDRDSYLIETEQSELRAQILGAMRYEASEPIDFPLVGDYVSLKVSEGCSQIERILPRQNLFARRTIDGGHVLQPIAANIDTLFVALAVNRDFNVRRLERYVVAAAALGVPFAVILTKIDLVEVPQKFAAEIHSMRLDVPILAVSSINGDGMNELQKFLGPEKTIAFVGSSGVGKSTLINAMRGNSALPTQEIRIHDDRGKHTTTRRLLIYLPDGTAVIDTPGMREFALADASDGIDTAFKDVAQLAQSCRFSKCRHHLEPGCAVRESVDEDRLESWRRLEREAAYELRKTDRRAAPAEKDKWKTIHKAIRRNRKDEQ